MPATKYRKTATSDKPWDAGANEKRLKEKQPQDYYERAYAWRDPKGDPQTKAAYKLLHHEVSADGDIGAANIKACQSVIGVLNGARGGADIPSGDRRGVYEHVAQHLKDAKVEPAPLRSGYEINGAEMRTFDVPDLRAEPEGGVIEGHAAVFDQPANLLWFTEIIERGAFDKTDFTDVLFGVNHNLRAIPLARSRNNNTNSTLQLQVDDKGLKIRAVLDVENNAEARALYSAVKRGDIRGMSVAMFVRGDRWENMDSDMPIRHITDIAKVIEVTAASLPAYEGTDIAARDQRALESAARTLESARSRLDSQKGEQQVRETEIEILRLKNRIQGAAF